MALFVRDKVSRRPSRYNNLYKVRITLPNISIKTENKVEAKAGVEVEEGGEVVKV